METKLNDFSSEQLQLLLNAVENYRQDIINGRIPSRAIEECQDDLNLLRTQILTSIGTVAMREKTYSN